MPALRTLCSRLEEAVLLCLDNVSYKDLWEPVDRVAFPQYYAVVARPMDLSTLRRNILNRDYVTYDMFDQDLQLVHSNAVQFNGEHHNISRCAKKAVQVIRSYLAEERKQRERDARECSFQYKIACTRASEVMKWLRHGFGLPEEAAVETPTAADAGTPAAAATAMNVTSLQPRSAHVQPAELRDVGMGGGDEEEEEEIVIASQAIPISTQTSTPTPFATMADNRQEVERGEEEEEDEIVLGGGGAVPLPAVQLVNAASPHLMLDEDEEEEEEIVLTEQQVRLAASHAPPVPSPAASGSHDESDEEEIVLTHGNV